MGYLKINNYLFFNRSEIDTYTVVDKTTKNILYFLKKSQFNYR